MKPKISTPDYRNWILQLKQKFQQTQIKAAVQVNQELLKFYWELGADIVEKQKKTDWGSKFINQLSSDLLDAFPDVKGFSLSNIKYIRQWYLFYNQRIVIGQQLVGQLKKEVPPLAEDAIVQQVVAQLPDSNIEQLFQIPWGHHIAIISKCKTVPEAHFYPTN
ncbi:MAG TPA: DUF1016 N-terminal domain-containing protein [Prolixibacteraceae bacterium]